MLVELISSIAIIASVGFFNFLDNYEKDEESTLFIKSVLVTVVIAAISAVVTKLAYGTEKIKSEPIKKDGKKKSKNKLSNKRIERKKATAICREEETLNTFTIDDDKKCLKANRRNVLNHEDSIIDEEEDIDRGIFVTDEKLLDIEKDERKRAKHSNQNENTETEFADINGSIVKKNKKEGICICGVWEGHIKTDKSSKAYISHSHSSNKLENDTITVSKSTVKGKVNLDEQYLKQGAKPKNNATLYVGHTSKISEELCNSSSERRSESSLKNNERSTISTTVHVFRMDTSHSESHGTLVDNESVSSGLYFEKSIKYYETSDVLYRKVAIDFCDRLRQFKELHFAYCMEFTKRMFEVKDDKLIVVESADNLFSELTSHKEILFFIIKVFLLGSFSTVCGGRRTVDSIRYCSTHFYNQSLLDKLLAKIIVDVPTQSKVKKLLESQYQNLSEVPTYSPHSGKFFSKVFDICCSLSSVELSEHEQELVDLAILTCALYCGHMVAGLYRMFVYDKGLNCIDDVQLGSCLRAKNFCYRCSNIKNTMTHMYHPTEGEVPRNIGDVIAVPLAIWRNCSKQISETVKESVNQGKMGFKVFVKDIIQPIKSLISIPNTRRLYRKDIDMYESKIKTATSLLPFHQAKIIFSKDKAHLAKSL